ncbi:hypothetical protein DM558_06115 [Entomomonas moraniae]|uniref:Uncharacterized protein n=1 Tax=Entomomonas moraniae TaxID=2213226 RepID=A0A3Q9JLC5_9GAMM|nr:hypothetical protein [Entomomonas moraniae]AZS50375.1 hypothetical protein DM558_06115 [Entomomonas moraniae]
MFTMIAMVVMVAISLFTQPKTQKPKPQAMNADDMPRCEEGNSKAIAFGQVKTKDYIVFWCGGFYTKAIKQKGGKK